MNWKTAWITGASTGIGRELALQLAAKGVAVTASARSAEKLTGLAAERPGITALPLDVSKREDVQQAIDRLVAAEGMPDLVILNAGVWHPMGVSDYDAAKVEDSIAVNYLGVTNCLASVMPIMTARRSGHIALVSSVAAYRGLPKSAAYSPTKAAITSLVETLYADLANYGVKITLVSPGFVETPMTAVNEFPMPLILKPDDAAARIIRGLEKGKYEIAFPWQIVTALKLARIAPNWLFNWYVRTRILPLGRGFRT